MAKWGEGDARWQVADLGEAGRNVNAWHWVEKDALPWSRERLQELLGSADLAPGSGLAVRGTGLKSCEGEAVVNNRKNKIIAAYELAVVVGWECVGEDGGTVAGELRMPYISEENHDEDPELQARCGSSSCAGGALAWAAAGGGPPPVAADLPGRGSHVAVTSEGPAAQKAKEAILSSGKKVIYDAVATFVQELRAGGPMRSGVAQPKAAPAQSVDAAVAAAAGEANGSSAPAAAAATQPVAAAEKENATETPAGSGHSIELREKFFAGAAELFECFTVAPRMMAFSQSPAEAQPQPGGRFSMFGGSVQGVYREVQPNSRILLDWRFSNWEDGVFSRLELCFDEPDKGNTTVTLKQTGIPDADRFGNHDVVGVTEAGWRQQVFDRIRRVFGYGC
ncbi:hypothetical protein CHLNCDRAFT_53624 [Chlorella variabilis]|uniref:Activator of Hsp90 ATPase AHSA1-like N-terminal domain-containing protein n=1 Tax=Chlorella variabilis TaxID=554065 RepID=E1ZKG7_CHLVA|nr:hypothetical protein CHLNCDRAFT_53624 [Chlorella variabilis]EFN53803.1 hypothetical protein CHLNCDRAFT_53624 [Chlorella variabilis]|eukprot:XP_005845905.1 hypothetical protein CHLNCDRAFT_53624 [Chlorella variabilis]